MTIDPDAKVIDMAIRRFWLFTSKDQIRFTQIRQVVYGYNAVGDYAFSAAHRQEDLFTVGVELNTMAQVELFKFYGEGSFANEVWPDWMYPQQKILDPLVTQDQEENSSSFAGVLSNLIGVPIGMYRS